MHSGSVPFSAPPFPMRHTSESVYKKFELLIIPGFLEVSGSHLGITFLRRASYWMYFLYLRIHCRLIKYASDPGCGLL
jgi:hypothetical protein